MIAIEYIADRLTALLVNRAVDVPIESTDVLRKLGGRLADAHARLIAEGYLKDRLAIELPALAQSVADVQARFDELIVEARGEVPPMAQAQIVELKRQLATSEVAIGELRKQRDDYARQFGDLEMIRDAALQWRKDNYTPRLQSAIDAFSRRQVTKR